MDGEQHRESGDGVATGNAAPATALGLGLVLIGAAALVVSVFLPFAQPVYGIPIVGNNNIFQKVGFYILLIPALIAHFGYGASQGKQNARWPLFISCAIAGVGIVFLGIAKSMRTLYLVGPDGAADTSQPGMTAHLGIAIYVAGAAVAVALIGALALVQSADKTDRLERAHEIQRRFDAQDKAEPGGNPEPKQAALEAESSATEVEPPAAEARARAIGSLVQSTWPLAAAVVVVVAAVAGYLLLGRPSTGSQSSTAAQQTPPSLTPEQTSLQKLLLSPDQINTAWATPGWRSAEPSAR